MRQMRPQSAFGSDLHQTQPHHHRHHSLSSLEDALIVEDRAQQQNESGGSETNHRDTSLIMRSGAAGEQQQQQLQMMRPPSPALPPVMKMEDKPIVAELETALRKMAGKGAHVGADLEIGISISGGLFYLYAYGYTYLSYQQLEELHSAHHHLLYQLNIHLSPEPVGGGGSASGSGAPIRRIKPCIELAWSTSSREVKCHDPAFVQLRASVCRLTKVTIPPMAQTPLSASGGAAVSGVSMDMENIGQEQVDLVAASQVEMQPFDPKTGASRGQAGAASEGAGSGGGNTIHPRDVQHLHGMKEFLYKLQGDQSPAHLYLQLIQLRPGRLGMGGQAPIAPVYRLRCSGFRFINIQHLRLIASSSPCHIEQIWIDFRRSMICIDWRSVLYQSTACWIASGLFQTPMQMFTSSKDVTPSLPPLSRSMVPVSKFLTEAANGAGAGEYSEDRSHKSRGPLALEAPSPVSSSVGDPVSASASSSSSGRKRPHRSRAAATQRHHERRAGIRRASRGVPDSDDSEDDAEQDVRENRRVKARMSPSGPAEDTLSALPSIPSMSASSINGNVNGHAMPTYAPLAYSMV
jgi:hypothetical protein